MPTQTTVVSFQRPGRARSRYLANTFASSADDLTTARDKRWRQLLFLQGVTNLDRVGVCRKHRTFVASNVNLRLGADGVARYGNVQTCGSVWACPLCTVAIRSRRVEQVEAVGRAHLEAGGLLDFGTFTLPHDRDDSLADLMTAARSAWSSMQRTALYRRMKKAGEILGALVAVEITHGYNGWHPHLHVLLFTAPGVDRKPLLRAMSRGWQSGVVAAGYRRPSDSHGSQWSSVAGSVEALASYLQKVQDGQPKAGGSVAAELVRGDAKRGKSAHHAPFQLLELASLGGKTPAQLRKSQRALALWREYETATKGRRALTGLPPLLKHYGLAEDQADDDLAAADAAPMPGDKIVCEFTDPEWRSVIRYKYRVRLLRDAERGGLAAVSESLATLGRREAYERRKAG